MRILNKLRLFFIAAILSFSIFGCKKNDDSIDLPKGVYISNEGGFQNYNGSVSFFNPENDSIKNYLFESANPGKKTGDIVQSFTIAGDKGIVVSNNENALKIVDLKTFSFIKALPVTYPRYGLFNNSKVYITQGALSGKVFVLDLATMVFSDSIKVGTGPEKLVQKGNQLFVANNGGFGKDSTVFVIDMTSNKVQDTLKVGADNPADLVFDANGNMWVLCIGYSDFMDASKNTPAKLVKISGSDHTILSSFTLKETSYLNPHRLAISPDKKTIYYTETDGVYAISADATVLPASPIISKSLYGLAVNPKNGDIYCFENTSFTTSGTMYIYDAKGLVKFSGKVGIAPNGAAFNL